MATVNEALTVLDDEAHRVLVRTIHEDGNGRIKMAFEKWQEVQRFKRTFPGAVASPSASRIDDKPLAAITAGSRPLKYVKRRQLGKGPPLEYSHLAAMVWDKLPVEGDITASALLGEYSTKGLTGLIERWNDAHPDKKIYHDPTSANRNRIYSRRPFTRHGRHSPAAPV